MTTSMRTFPSSFIRLTIASVFCISLAASLGGCSGSNGNDKIRIGSGQVGNSTTKGADFPIFYVKRTNPNFVATTTTPAVDDDIHHQNVCRVGGQDRVCGNNADLYMRDRATTTANEYNITARVRTKSTEVWDVRDVDVSPDGTKVIFSMRGPIKNNQDPKDPPTWNIWEYVIAKDDLHRVIADDVSADAGQDVSPHYLPDGHIIFSSTRQRESKAVLLDEGQPQFESQVENGGRRGNEAAFVLHVMNADGTNIQQFTFNQSHDIDPTVLSDGRIMFSRWDHAPGRNGIHLYTTNPDGTNTQLLYGSASHNTVADVDPTTNNTITYPNIEFVKAREMQDGGILTLVRPDTGTEFGGDLYIIDTKTYVENHQATLASAGSTGPAQMKALSNNVRLVPAPSEGGRFVSAFPLWDGTNRILVSWNQCRALDADGVTIVPCPGKLNDPTTVAAPPIYSIWMFDPEAQTLQPIVIAQEGVMMSDVVVAQPRTIADTPKFLPYNLNADPSINTTLLNEAVGVLDIRSVYDFDGQLGTGTGMPTSLAAVSDPGSTAYTNRTARFLRIEKAVSLPDKDVRDIDFGAALGAAPYMREIIGYIPIEPDGSVRTKVPANVALQIAITDAGGRTLPQFSRHNAWISVRPGETLQCNGCHVPTMATAMTNGQSGISHGRSGLFAPLNAGAGAANTTFPNANTVYSSVNVGDTMAQARSTWSCVSEKCASITPSVNLIFSDVWPMGSDPFIVPATARTTDTLLSYTGGAGVPRAPTSSTCASVAWSSQCRIVINYKEHIQPIWDLPRNEVTDTTVGSPTFGFLVSASTCTFCHNHNQPTNPAQQPVPGPMVTATNIAAWQLDLRGLLPDNNDNDNYTQDQFVSYQELFFADSVINADPTSGAVSALTIQQPSGQVDAMGNPILVPQKVGINGTRLSSQNAAASRFFSVFLSNQCQHTTILMNAGIPVGTSTQTGGCLVNHQGWLTTGELRLITEWVEIGGAYFNDPFKAPVN